MGFMNLLTFCLCFGFCALVSYVSLRRRLKTLRNNPARPSSFFGTSDHAINVRSADNVRLLSDDQIDAVERGADDE
jgi:hypothetical protein